MAIQNRRGAYADFDPTKMVAGEFAVVQTGDPNADDGKAVYMAFSAGSVKRLATYEDMQQSIADATEDIAQNIEDAVADDVAAAQQAAEQAQQAAETLTIDSTLTHTGQAADAKAVGDEISSLKEDLNSIEETIFDDTIASPADTSNGYIRADGIYYSATNYRMYRYRIDETCKFVTATGGNIVASGTARNIGFISFYSGDWTGNVDVAESITYDDSTVYTRKVAIPEGATTCCVCVAKGYVDEYGVPEVILAKANIRQEIEKKADSESTITAKKVATHYLSHRYLSKAGLPTSTQTMTWNLYKVDVSDCKTLKVRTFRTSTGSTTMPLYSFVSTDFADVTVSSETSDTIVSVGTLIAPTSNELVFNVQIPEDAKTMFVSCTAEQADSLVVAVVDFGLFTELMPNGEDESGGGINIFSDSPYFRKVRWGTGGLNEYYHSADDGVSLFSGATTAEQFFTMFNALVADYTGYADSHEMGVASDGVTTMYYYTFYPLSNEDTDVRKRPKVIISAGQHGFEKTANFGLYWFCKNLLENWESNSTLAYIRNHVQLIIMPMLNPYGFDHDQYTNANGVNLNRNWGTLKWSTGTEGSTSYGGPEPFSEVETQYARDVILANLDAIWLCDYHNNGQTAPSSQQGLLWHSFALMTYDDTYFAKAINAAKAHIDEITGHLYKDYPDHCSYAISGKFTDNNAPSHQGLIVAYAREQNIMAATMEGGAAFSGGNRYASAIHHLNADLIGNWIRYIINCFSVLY